MGCGCHEAVGKEGLNKELCLAEGGGKSRSITLNFQVGDVRKPLLAVCRVVEKGNEVKFGPVEEGTYIKNPKTGDKCVLRPNGKGSYLMGAKFPGRAKTEVTVDSGAEESVCPSDWGRQFGLKRAERKLD